MKNKIKETREELGMSQEELSKKSGVSRTTISELETGKTDVITNVTLEKISNALNRKVTEIFFQD
ncbi:MAG: helix-turn-helix transcriptional regulator [Clostridia bacterium]|nr:helix-turn-helix transcriptional regulator [Clostridia bacterium]